MRVKNPSFSSLFLPITLLFTSLFLIVIITGVSAQDVKKTTCDEKFVCNGGSKPCKKNLGTVSLVKLTVELGNTVDPPRFYQFCIPMDQLSQLNIANSFEYMTKHADSYVRLHLTKNISSPKRNFVSADKKLYAAFLTGIIVLDNGLFNNRTLTWDNSCIGDICVSGGGKCVREQDCALKTDEAPKPEEGETRGVKIMIAFAGYDDILTPLSSAGSLPTKFTAFAWSSYFGQLASMFLPAN